MTQQPGIRHQGSWRNLPLGDPAIATVLMGQSPESSSYNTVGQGLPFFQGKADFGLRNPVPTMWCSAPGKIAEPGDILMSVRAPVGDVNIASQKSCIGRGLAAIRAGESMDSQFLFYVLMHGKARLDALGTGATFKSINKDTLLRFGVPIPALNEQQGIAHHLSKVHLAVENQDAIASHLLELKASAMERLFREGIFGRPVTMTPIGLMPEDWKLSRLGDIATIGNGSTPKRTKLAYWSEGKTPWITSGKVHETFIRGADQFITELARKECHLPLIPAGSIVVAITGQGKTLGNAALVTFPTCINQHLAYLKLKTHEIEPEYVLGYLKFRYQHLRQAANAGGSTKAALTCRFLQDYPIPLPGVEERRKIGQILNSLHSAWTQAEERRKKLNTLFYSMLSALIAGDVRFGLDSERLS